MAELSGTSFSLANALAGTVIAARRSDGHKMITGVPLRYGQVAENTNLRYEGKKGV
jgi:hypothetical protein